MSHKDPKPNQDESRLDKIRATYDRWCEAWAAVWEELDEDMKCLSMDGPWPEKERKIRATPGNERPCLHEDVITQFNNMTTNQLEMNPMGIDVQPEGDGANEKTAEFVESRIRQIEYEQNGQHSYLTAGKSAVECSIGCWEIETDWVNPFVWDRQFVICPIQDPKSVVPDPDARKPDWCDMRGYFKLTRMSHEEFREKYPGAEIHDFKGYLGQKAYANWIDDHTVQVAKYAYVECEKQTLLLLEDGTPEGWTLTEKEAEDKWALRRFKNAMRVQTDEWAVLGHSKGKEFPILKKSKRDIPTVKICLTNGVEILEETEWDDCEVPLLMVTGRIKFQQGKRVIDSQTRKARTGQLLYDLCISSIQEETARVPKTIYMGYEGQFDTSTNWGKLNREFSGYAEAKAKTDESGEEVLPHPQLVQREPQIQALLELKQSILIGIQNVLGISSTERKDRASKSGKALEELTEDMNVATYHYHNSLRMAQLRQYRIFNRMLPKIENTPREVGLRDAKGNYKTQKIGANHYDELGRHEVVISSAKYYQSLQEEQSDFAESLLKSINDPTIMLAVLPDLIRMKGLGPFGDDLAKMVEAMQPPQMQQARMQDGSQQISPAMVQQIAQQAQATIKALNAHAEQIESQRDQLLFEKKAEAEKLKNQIAIEAMREKVQLEVATINASVKERMDSLDAQVASIKHIADMLVDKFTLDHTAQQNELDRQHEQDLAAQQAATAAQQAQTQPEQANA